MDVLIHEIKFSEAFRGDFSRICSDAIKVLSAYEYMMFYKKSNYNGFTELKFIETVEVKLIAAIFGKEIGNFDFYSSIKFDDGSANINDKFLRWVYQCKNEELFLMINAVLQHIELLKEARNVTKADRQSLSELVITITNNINELFELHHLEPLFIEGIVNRNYIYSNQKQLNTKEASEFEELRKKLRRSTSKNETLKLDYDSINNQLAVANQKSLQLRSKLKFKLGKISDSEFEKMAENFRFFKNKKLNLTAFGKSLNVKSDTIKAEIKRRNLQYIIEHPKSSKK